MTQKSLEETLSNELRTANKDSLRRFRSKQLSIPNGGGLVGSQAGFVIAEEWERGVGAYKDVFIRRGEEFTQGYVEGRKGRVRNLFSRRYWAARQALEEMQGPNYEKNLN